ncbi:19883_t:CDS:1, partial [Funneliformis geosporum]
GTFELFNGGSASDKLEKNLYPKEDVNYGVLGKPKPKTNCRSRSL